MVTMIIAVFSLFFDQRTPFLGVRLFGYEITVFVLCIVVGVFVDVDHIVDFRVNRGFRFKNLGMAFNAGRMFEVFHGIENVPVLTGLSVVFPFLIFPTISYACHLMMDIYGNGASFQPYFYSFRIAKIASVRPRGGVDQHRAN
jgi:hypothetical protein